MSYFEIKPLVKHMNIPSISLLSEHLNPNRILDCSPTRRGYRLLNVKEGTRTSFNVDEKEPKKNFIFAGLF